VGIPLRVRATCSFGAARTLIMCRLGQQKVGVRISVSEDYRTESGTDIERTVFFSDAVFAIAITLLALDLQVPRVPEDLAAAELPSALLELWPKFVSFLISFWIVASYGWPTTASSTTSGPTTAGCS
jgi:hypothetical protein